MDSNALVFDAVGEVRQITLKLADSSLSLEVLEMDASTNEQFVEATRRRMVRHADGQMEVERLQGLRFELLSRCVRHADSKKLVTTDEWKKLNLPNRTLQSIYVFAANLNKDNGSGFEALLDLVKTRAEQSGFTEDQKAAVISAMESSVGE